jgi:hypothetical protein
MSESAEILLCMDKSTIWAAWIGAATGACSLAWNIYLKVTSGPKLKIHVHAGMVTMPPRPGNPHFLRIAVRNVGNAPTTITNYSFHSFEGLHSRFRKSEFNAAKSAVITNYSGKQCPAKLEVGEELNVIMEHDSRFEEWLEGGLWVGVSHSFGRRAQLVKIYDGGKTSGR